MMNLWSSLAKTFGRRHDYSALVGLKIHRGSAEVVGMKIWPHVDYSIVVKDTVSLYHREGMRMLAIDATDAMVEPIQTMLTSQGVLIADIKFGEYVDWTNPWGTIEHAPIKHAMIEYARACMQEKIVHLPKTGSSETGDELLRQLREQEIVKGSENGRIVYGHPENRHDDLAWAFLMALYVSRPFLTGAGTFGMVISSTRKEYVRSFMSR